MKCGETADLMLKLLSTGGGEAVQLSTSEMELLDELIANGSIARVEIPEADTDKLARLRESLHLYQIKEQDTLNELYGHPQVGKDRRALMRLLDTIDQEEAGLRLRILKLSEAVSLYEGSVSVDGQRLVVTYKGRELIENLNPRLPRVADWSLEDFHRELLELQGAFDARAMKAAALLREISPRLPRIDEIHLRGASVGLSVRDESPTELAAAYVVAVKALEEEIAQFSTGSIAEDRRVSIAEQLCLNASPLTEETARTAAHTFTATWWTISGRTFMVQEEAVRCALMLYSKAVSDTYGLLERAREFSTGAWQPLTPFSASLAASILLVAKGEAEAGTVERFITYQTLLRQREPVEEADFASAILAVAGGDDIEAVQERFRIAKDYLSRFTENGMVSPAAMVAVMATDVEEVLDTLRIASARISQYHLSLGGMENLSLGVKMILGTALVPIIGKAVPAPAAMPPPPGGRLLAVAGLAGLAVATPVLLPALLSFHDRNLHRLAVSDYHFHPVHTHYVYG